MPSVRRVWPGLVMAQDSRCSWTDGKGDRGLSPTPPRNRVWPANWRRVEADASPRMALVRDLAEPTWTSDFKNLNSNVRRFTLLSVVVC